MRVARPSNSARSWRSRSNDHQRKASAPDGSVPTSAGRSPRTERDRSTCSSRRRKDPVDDILLRCLGRIGIEERPQNRLMELRRHEAAPLEQASPLDRRPPRDKAHVELEQDGGHLRQQLSVDKQRRHLTLRIDRSELAPDLSRGPPLDDHDLERHVVLPQDDLDGKRTGKWKRVERYVCHWVLAENDTDPPSWHE